MKKVNVVKKAPKYSYEKEEKNKLKIKSNGKRVVAGQ